MPICSECHEFYLQKIMTRGLPLNLSLKETVEFNLTYVFVIVVCTVSHGVVLLHLCLFVLWVCN